MTSSAGFDLELFECARGGGKIKHYLKSPITLLCGHNMCRDCLDALLDQNQTVKCGNCNTENEIKTIKINDTLSKLIDFFSIDLIKSSASKFKYILHEANGKYYSLNLILLQFK